MPKFIDLKLGRFDSEASLRGVLRDALRGGYVEVGVVVSPSIDLNSYGPPTYPRVHRVAELSTRDPAWTSKLRPDRPYRSVLPHTVEACRRAAGLRMVDGIVLPPSPRRMIFDEVCARRLARSGGVVEVGLAPLLGLRGWELSATLRVIRRELRIASIRRVPVLLTTMGGAGPGVPDARSAVLLAESLLGISRDQAMAGLTDVPAEILSGMLSLRKRGFTVAREDA